jgi:hypothetical protein
VTGFDYSGYLRDGLRGANWFVTDLWIAAVGIGGSMDLKDVQNIASGQREPSRREYDVLAVALNEQYLDLGQNHPMNSWDELPMVSAPPSPST